MPCDTTPTDRVLTRNPTDAKDILLTRREFVPIGQSVRREQTLRVDDPDGKALDIDDLRLMWEEFVDALRQSTCTAEEQAAHSDGALPASYDALESPVMAKNKSFSNLMQDLSNHVSPDTSNRGEEQERELA